jgi:predicted DNA-binding transcriptional regulator YafY
MNFIKQFERIKRVNRHIKRRTTGDPDEFSAKLNISRRQLFRIIAELKDYGAPIEYNRRLRTFYYKDEDFEMKVNLTIEFITEQDEKEIYGGFISSNLLQCHFLALNNNTLAIQ